MFAPSPTHRLLMLALLAATGATSAVSAAQPAPGAAGASAPTTPNDSAPSDANAASPATTAAPAAPEPSVTDDDRGPYQTPDYIKKPASLPPETSAPRVLKMGLSEAIALAIHQNLGLEIQRYSQRAAEADARTQHANFEPTLSGSGPNNAIYTHNEADTPPQTSQEGQAGQNQHQTNNFWGAAVLQRLRTGTSLQLQFNNSWARSTLGTAVAPDVFRSTVQLTVTQPLLRGFSVDTDIPSDDILRTMLNSKKELEKTRQAVSDTVQSIEKAYWEVVRALKSYEVQATSVERAQLQLELTQRQIDAGLLPPSDLIAAEGTLATRKLGLVKAEATILDNTDELRRQLRLPQDQWALPIVPAEVPTFSEVTPDVSTLLARAKRQRPELRQTEIDLEQARRGQRKQENALLPQLDVGAGYGYVGQDSTYARALDKLGTGQGKFWSAFVNFSWAPLGLAARSEGEHQALLVGGAELSDRSKALDIDVDVRKSARAVTTAARQVRAAAKARRLAQASLDAEERKFMSGQSSNFVIAQRQEDVAQANLNELNAVIDHAKALVDLDHATGDLLRRRNVELTVTPGR